MHPAAKMAEKIPKSPFFVASSLALRHPPNPQPTHDPIGHETIVHMHRPMVIPWHYTSCWYHSLLYWEIQTHLTCSKLFDCDPSFSRLFLRLKCCLSRSNRSKVESRIALSHSDFSQMKIPRNSLCKQASTHQPGIIRRYHTYISMMYGRCREGRTTESPSNLVARTGTIQTPLWLEPSFFNASINKHIFSPTRTTDYIAATEETKSNNVESEDFVGGIRGESQGYPPHEIRISPVVQGRTVRCVFLCWTNGPWHNSSNNNIFLQKLSPSRLYSRIQRRPSAAADYYSKRCHRTVGGQFVLFARKQINTR